MGNIAFVSFKRNFTGEQFRDALQEIVSDRFGDLLIIEVKSNKGKIYYWNVLLADDLLDKSSWQYEVDFYRNSKRKFGGKHPHSQWGGWLMYVIHSELSFRYNGRCSDEGVMGTWAGDPQKYPTYRTWFENMNRYMNEHHNEEFEKLFEYTPQHLRDL